MAMPRIGEVTFCKRIVRGAVANRLAMVMRLIRGKSDHHLEAHRRLSPRNGAIPVGGAHIDELAVGEGLAVFLRSMARGESASASEAAGKAEAALIFRNWNRSRPKEYQVQRPTDQADHWVEWAARLCREALENRGPADFRPTRRPTEGPTPVE